MTVLPDPTSLGDDELSRVIRQLSEQDEYDWESRARKEQLPPEGSWLRWLILAGRGSGKMLDVATRVPTPSGWSTMGALQPGDVVLDEQGRPTTVLWCSTPLVPDVAYRMTFSDGSFVDACSEHQWVTWTHRDRKQYQRYAKARTLPYDWSSWQGVLLDSWGNETGRYGPQVRTTQSIVDTLTVGNRADRNHCIPLTAPLQLPEVVLPLDPWLLGYWLANGSTGSGELTAGSKDGDFDEDHVASMLSSAGWDHSRRLCAQRGTSWFGITGLRNVLRGMGVADVKHVPSSYLRASERQRLALLRGLCDGDGYADPVKKTVEYTSVNELLAKNVLELVRSLGEKPVLAEGRARLNGVDMGPKWRVTWRPTVCNPFALPRKATVIVEPSSQGLRRRHRMINGIERLADPPLMRCITVDSPSSMYLVGEAMIPTHNTRSATETLRMWATRQPLQIAVVNRNNIDCRDICFEHPRSGLRKVIPNDMHAEYNRSLGETRLLLKNGTIFRGFSAEKPDNIRGWYFDVVWFDEYGNWAKQTAQDMYDQAWYTLREAMLPRMIITTTPKRRPHMIALARDAGLLKDSIPQEGWHVTRMHTRDNRANLGDEWLKSMLPYEGTRLGRQELGGELLEDVDNALWTLELVESARLYSPMPELVQVVTAVDASGSEDGDETGIVTAARNKDYVAYVLADDSTKGTPEHRYEQACLAAARWDSGVVLYEVNYGGDNIALGLRAAWEHLGQRGIVSGPCPRILPSSKKGNGPGITGSKVDRAEPVVALYEQQARHVAEFDRALPERIYHAQPMPKLEDEMVQWEPDSDWSPNRIDAMVYAVRYLTDGMYRRFGTWGGSAMAGARIG